MTYSAAKFEVATSNRLGGDTFTRNVTDTHPHGRTDRRTDFCTKLIYPFFLKKKAGIIRRKVKTVMISQHNEQDQSGPELQLETVYKKFVPKICLRIRMPMVLLNQGKCSEF